MTGALIIQHTRTKSIADAIYNCSDEMARIEDMVRDDKPQNKKTKKKQSKLTCLHKISNPNTFAGLSTHNY
jgi:hypothetical protein